MWKNRWLPDPTYNNIVSPKGESSVSQVSELFYPNTRTWDPGKLEETFYLREAELVNQIQVGEGSALVWPLTANGSYSV